ncbi:MAG: PRD domain-containing protein [[Clostridium] innocuum]
MELNQICLSLLELLFQNDGSCTFSHVHDTMQLSKRSLEYQIEKLNAFLKQYRLPEIQCGFGTIQIPISIQQQLERILLSDSLLDWYFLSARERSALLVLLILIQKTATTTDALCEQLKVSRNTIVSDLTQLKKSLPLIGLKLVANHKSGYKIMGDEITIRLFMLENIHVFYMNAYSQHYIMRFIALLFDEYLSPLHSHQISCLLADTFDHRKETEAHSYTSEARNDILLHIYIMLFRHHASQIPVYMEEMKQTGEYHMAELILNRIYTEQIPNNAYTSDLYYLTAILLSSNINGTFDISVVETDVLAFTDKFLRNFEKLTFIHLESRDELKEKLLLHIRPMYYRLKYGIRLHNVLNDDIKKDYALYFYLTKKAVKLSINNQDPDLPEDEIAYLCVYLAGWINQSVSQIEQEEAADKLLLVIPGGNSMSSLIQLQLINLLKPLRFQYEIISSQDFKESMADDYPLVLYNGSYNGFKKNIIMISTHMNESQRNRILQWSARYSNMDHNDELTHLYELIKNHCIVQDEDLLKVKLFNFLTAFQTRQQPQLSSLLQILRVSSISLLSEAMAIDKLLLLATKQFIRNHTVKDLYVANLMHLLSTMGAYGEITQGVLLLHAENVQYCNHLGVHICNLKIPLHLKNNPDAIHTIILLSTPDKTSHLRILKDLSQLFRDHTFVKRLEQYSFADEQELYHEICAIIKMEN